MTIANNIILAVGWLDENGKYNVDIPMPKDVIKTIDRIRANGFEPLPIEAHHFSDDAEIKDILDLILILKMRYHATNIMKNSYIETADESSTLELAAQVGMPIPDNRWSQEKFKNVANAIIDAANIIRKNSGQPTHDRLS